MISNPLDLALIAGVFALFFGPRNLPKPPFSWKPETYEQNPHSPIDPFRATPVDLFVNNDRRSK